MIYDIMQVENQWSGMVFTCKTQIFTIWATDKHAFEVFLKPQLNSRGEQRAIGESCYSAVA